MRAGLLAPLLASLSFASEIPFELHSNLIFLAVRVNGSPPRSFILDTGASVSFLNEKLAQSLGLEVGRQHESNIGTGETGTRIGSTKNVAMSLGDGIEVPTKNLAVVPLAQIETLLGRTIDGIVGSEIFFHNVVEIGYAARKIVLRNPKEYEYHGQGEIVPLRLSGNRPFVKASVTPIDAEPIDGLFVIDTGDAGILGLHTPFVEKHNLRSPDRKMISVPTHGLGGESRNWLGRLESFHLGKFAVGQPVTTFAEATKGSEASRSYDGVIGGEILRRFTVIFDYSRRQMILEPNAALTEPYEYNMSGALLAASGEGFETIKVARILDASPASEAGLREGDSLVAIDGRPATELTLDRIHELFKKEGKEYDLEIGRGETKVQVKIRMRRLI